MMMMRHSDLLLVKKKEGKDGRGSKVCSWDKREEWKVRKSEVENENEKVVVK